MIDAIVLDIEGTTSPASSVREGLYGYTRGIALYVFSSGSVRNQQDWFAHARGGELASLISGWFDLTTAGAKREEASYRKIAVAMDLPGDKILFLSDHSDELDAAAAAGWAVLGVARVGEPNSPSSVGPPHRWVSSFTEIDPRDLSRGIGYSN